MSNKNKTEQEIWTMWIDDQKRIVSFHNVDGFIKTYFIYHKHFIHYVDALQNRGYFFQ